MRAHRDAAGVVIAALLMIGAFVSVIPDTWLTSPFFAAPALWWSRLALSLALWVVYDYARSAASAWRTSFLPARFATKSASSA